MSRKDKNFGGWRHYSNQYRTFADCHHTAGVPQSIAASLVLGDEREGWPWGQGGVGDMWEGKGLCKALPAQGCDEGQSTWNLHLREDRNWTLGRDTNHWLAAQLQPGTQPELHSRISNHRWPSLQAPTPPRVRSLTCSFPAWLLLQHNREISCFLFPRNAPPFSLL